MAIKVSGEEGSIFLVLSVPVHAGGLACVSYVNVQ